MKVFLFFIWVLGGSVAQQSLNYDYWWHKSRGGANYGPRQSLPRQYPFANPSRANIAGQRFQPNIQIIGIEEHLFEAKPKPASVPSAVMVSPPSVSPADPNSGFVNFTCSKGFQIYISSASYGKPPICELKNTLEKIRRECEGLEQCTFFAPVLLGDPCPGVHKALSADYECRYGGKLIEEVPKADDQRPKAPNTSRGSPELQRPPNKTKEPDSSETVRVSPSNASSTEVNEDLVLMCYYNEELGLIQEIVPANLCTHLVYVASAADISDGQLVSKIPSLYPRLDRLRKASSALVTLLGINASTLQGGSGVNYNILFRALEALGFNGIEIHWRPRNYNISEASLVDFINRLRASNLMLSVTLMMEREGLDQFNQLPIIASVTDFLTLAPVGTVVSVTDLEMAVEHAVNAMKLPKSKVLLGLPLSGQKIEYYTDKSGAAKTRIEILQYGNFCKWIDGSSNEWKVFWDQRAHAPYAVSQSSKQILNFYNKESLRMRMRLVSTKGLGGAGILDIEMDDYQGACGKSFELSYDIQNYLNIYNYPLNYTTQIKNVVYGIAV